MELKFQDYYGQHIYMHNRTGSGNIRLRVRTTPDMNEVRRTKEDDCTVETDISMSDAQARILLHGLRTMLGDDE